jgi:hypothetical protein
MSSRNNSNFINTLPAPTSPVISQTQPEEAGGPLLTGLNRIVEVQTIFRDAIAHFIAQTQKGQAYSTGYWVGYDEGPDGNPICNKTYDVAPSWEEALALAKPKLSMGRRYVQGIVVYHQGKTVYVPSAIYNPDAPVDTVIQQARYARHQYQTRQRRTETDPRSCPRCEGTGVVRSCMHVEFGRCFRCDGRGSL